MKPILTVGLTSLAGLYLGGGAWALGVLAFWFVFVVAAASGAAAGRGEAP